MMENWLSQKAGTTVPALKYAAQSELADVRSDTMTSAVMSVGDTFDGQIGSTADSDWIKVDLVAGESYVFAMWGTDYLFGISDTVLTLYDSDGLEVAFNNDISFFSSFSGFNYTATTTGIHYVEAGGYLTDTGRYRLQVADAVFTPEQVAGYLTEVDWGFSGPIRLGTQTGGTLTYSTTFLTVAGKQLAEWALESWSIATGITFVQGGFSTADILFDDDEPGAFASSSNISSFTGIIDQSRINVGSISAGTSWLDLFGTTIDSYSFFTYLHEVGHALGLGHAGPYDVQAIYGSDNLYANDSTQMSIMSYFDPSTNPTVNGDDVRFISPMPADLVAIQALYGTTQVYQGNTIWAANSNVGGWLGQLFGAIFDGNSVPSDFYDGEAIGFTIQDTGGIDTLDVSGLDVHQRIDLRAGRFSDINGSLRNVAIAVGTVIENVIGGAGNDSIQGNDADNRIEGGSGDDIINGAGGTDTTVLTINRDQAVVSTEGSVLVLASTLGTDRFRDVEFFQFSDALVSLSNLQNGTSGNETDGGTGETGETDGGTGGTDNLLLVGTDGADLLTGSALNDTISGGEGGDTLQGNGGNDQIAGSGGNDRIDGGIGDDNIGGGTGNDTIEGGDGNDTIGAGVGDDSITGGAGGDALFGGAGTDTITGGTGNDNIGAGFGGDTLDGEAGNDNMGGGTGRDLIFGGSGNDTMGGGEGDDTLVGGDGNDFLAGGGRDDRIDGGDGGDRINGGLGSDRITGGAGADAFIFTAYGAGETDIITDFQNGTDVMQFSGIDKIPGSGLQGFLDALNVTAVPDGISLSYAGNIIILEGIGIGQIGTEDFIFI